MAAPSTAQPLFAACVVALQLHRDRTFPPRRGRSAGGAPPAHPPARPPRAARTAQLRSAVRRGSHPGPRPARRRAAHAAARQPRGGSVISWPTSLPRAQQTASPAPPVACPAHRFRWSRCASPSLANAQALHVFPLAAPRALAFGSRAPAPRTFVGPPPAPPCRRRSAPRVGATALPPLRPCASGLRPAARPRHTGPQSGRTSAPRPPAPAARLPPGVRSRGALVACLFV